MAEPKQKRSRVRTRRAFSQKKIKSLQLAKCPECGKPAKAHTLCINCVPSYLDGHRKKTQPASN